MKFNVSQLLKDHTGATREFGIDDDVRIDGETHRLRGDARFDRTPDGVLVRAHVHGVLDDECSRCLSPVSVPIDLTIEEEYIPSVDVDSGGRVTPPVGEDDAYRIDERHMLDLGMPIRDYWNIARPMAPLCSEDCAGICPSCGQAAAAGHACGDAPSDDRWARLRDLKLHN